VADRAPDKITTQDCYRQICESHRAIAGFRARLLGFLPFGTGATVFVVFKDVYGTDKERLLIPLGIFGFFVTLGLLTYELRGIQDCTMLRKRAMAIEKSSSIEVDNSHFQKWLPGTAGVVDEVGAAWTIYLAVLAVWAFVALRGFQRHFAWWPAYWKLLIVFGAVYGVLLVAALAAYDRWVYQGTGEDLFLPRQARRVGKLLAKPWFGA
jgi:hypothetical protein